MKIVEIEAIPFAIPYRKPLRFASGEVHVADHVLVRVHTDDGVVGVAEAPPRPYTYGETQQSIVAAITTLFAPELVGLTLDRAAVGAGDVYGVVQPGEPADHGPVRDIVLRNERSAARARQHHDVEPAHVIGEEQYVARKRPSDGAHLHPRAAPDPPQEAPGPGRRPAHELPGVMERQAGDQARDDRGRAQGKAHRISSCG